MRDISQSFVFISFILILQSGSFAKAAVENVFLKSPDDLTIATQLDAEVSNVAKLMGACTQTKKSNSECLCQNQESIAVLNSQLKSTLEKRPAWETKTLNLKTRRGETLIIDIPGLVQQMKKNPCETSGK